MGSGTEAGTPMRGCFGVVLQMPCWGHFIWPFKVAGLGRRYLAMAFSVRCGALRRKPWWIAASKDDFWGLHRLWCMYFTLFSFVVQWYEMIAVSCGASLKQGSSGD
jgi:hypothetical protein